MQEAGVAAHVSDQLRQVLRGRQQIGAAGTFVAVRGDERQPTQAYHPVEQGDLALGQLQQCQRVIPAPHFEVRTAGVRPHPEQAPGTELLGEDQRLPDPLLGLLGAAVFQ